MQRRSVRVGRAFLWLALFLGLGHTAFSLYWAVGGTWLLDTVGQWAVTAQQQTPGQAFFVLMAVTVLKAAAASIPVAVEYDKIRGRRFWRLVSWVGGIGLMLYGGINSVVAISVLTGLVAPEAGFDERAMFGHAFLWDPWFFVWGLTLVTSLALTRSSMQRQ